MEEYKVDKHIKVICKECGKEFVNKVDIGVSVFCNKICSLRYGKKRNRLK